MEISGTKPYIVIISMLAATVSGLLLTEGTSVVETGNFLGKLPSSTGDYVGINVHHCQSMDCLKVWHDIDKKHMPCAVCGSESDNTSPIEKHWLPADTIIEKKLYTSPDGLGIATMLVTGGNERTSIHRPQMCLTGQGYLISKQSTMDITINGKATPLCVTVLEITTGDRQRKGLFVYWFISRDHETPYHLERMFRTAMDNIFHGKSTQWAYVSLMFMPNAGAQLTPHEIQDFISTLYPAIRTSQASAWDK